MFILAFSQSCETTVPFESMKNINVYKEMSTNIISLLGKSSMATWHLLRHVFLNVPSYISSLIGFFVCLSVQVRTKRKFE